MDLRKNEYGIRLILSQKNLLDLTAQAMMFEHNANLVRRLEDGTLVAVEVEPNGVHYEKRIAGPGSGLV